MTIGKLTGTILAAAALAAAGALAQTGGGSAGQTGSTSGSGTGTGTATGTTDNPTTKPGEDTNQSSSSQNPRIQNGLVRQQNAVSSHRFKNASIRTRWTGKRMKYIPANPEIAPDAPKLGTSMLPPNAAVANTCDSDAAIPQIK